MCYTGRRPDSFLIGSVLSACTSAAAINCTRETHCYAVRHGADMDIRVFSLLLDAYAKCGFSVLYHTVISNLGSHGFAANVIDLLDEMVSDELIPDNATFSALLATCCHVGLLGEGWKLFRRMRDGFHIIASLQHYVYMVRLLATFGQLKEAYDLI
jgi:pentatricopeptide repeat protein